MESLSPRTARSSPPSCTGRRGWRRCRCPPGRRRRRTACPDARRTPRRTPPGWRPCRPRSRAGRSRTSRRRSARSRRRRRGQRGPSPAAAAAVVERPYRQDPRGRGDTRDPGGVVAQGGDDAGDLRAVVRDRRRVAVVRRRDVVLGIDLAVQIGLARVDRRVDHGDGHAAAVPAVGPGVRDARVGAGRGVRRRTGSARCSAAPTGPRSRGRRRASARAPRQAARSAGCRGGRGRARRRARASPSYHRPCPGGLE